MEQYFALKPAFFVTKELQIWPIKKLLELQPQLESYIWLTVNIPKVHFFLNWRKTNLKKTINISYTSQLKHYTMLLLTKCMTQVEVAVPKVF
jgi:hypothetical protein